MRKDLKIINIKFLGEIIHEKEEKLNKPNNLISTPIILF